MTISAPRSSAWRGLATPVWVVLLGAAMASLLGLLLGRLAEDEALGGAIVGIGFAATVFAIVSIPWWLNQRENSVWAWILAGAFGLKMMSGLTRWWAIRAVYEGAGDANAYLDAGRELQEHWHRGIYIWQPDSLQGFPPETWRIGSYTGVVFEIVGANSLAAFAVFGLVGLIGQFCGTVAIRVLRPEAPLPVAAAPLFLPTLLYWTAAVGKDAVSMFGIGLSILAMAMIATSRPIRGVVLGVVGCLAVYPVRPHMYVPIAGGVLVMAVAMILRRRNTHGFKSRQLPLAVRVAVGVGAAALAFAFITGTEVLFPKTDQETGEEKLTTVEAAAENTNVGDSAFGATQITSPADIPMATINVFTRPFVWQAGSPQMMISAVEALALFVALILVVTRRRRRVLYAMKEPIVLGLATACAGYVFGLSALGNAGILARQRAQLFLPLVVLLALVAIAPPPPKSPKVLAQGRSGTVKGDADEDENDDRAEEGLEPDTTGGKLVSNGRSAAAPGAARQPIGSRQRALAGSGAAIGAPNEPERVD